MKRGALKLVIFLGVAPVAVTAEVIRCPDWKKLIAMNDGRAVLRSAAPGANFDLLVKNTSISTIVFVTTSYKSVEKIDHSPASVCEYKVVPGDSLSKISQTVIGSYARWREIQKLNAATLKGGTNLKVGQVLWMPCANASPANATIAYPIEKKTEKPLWSSKPGEAFTVVIKRWAKAAGVTPIIKTKDEWIITVPVRINGTFKQAIEELVEGLSNTGKSPPVRIYSNNILKLG